jgi:pimeloyl-ACP methyl ester carboxylesterase
MDTTHRRPRKRKSWWAAATIAMVTVTALSLAGAATVLQELTAEAATHGVPKPGPSDDSFYDAPTPLPSGQPGDILRWRSSIPLLNVLNASAWEVMYLSTDVLGNRNAVTGTILVPKEVDPAKIPIVSFAVGTQGPAFKCAPSKSIRRGTLYDQLAVDDSISSGFAVVITDYEGYGPNTTPTYMTGRSMAPAVIDVVRAAQRLPAAKLSGTAKVIFQGYSQGGGGALWAAERQPTYAPELNLVGAVGGGVPADLAAVAKGLDGHVGFGFLMFAAMGLDAAYPELKLDSFLNNTGRAEIAKAKAEYCAPDLLVRQAFKKIGDFTTSDPLNTPQWKARIAENKLGDTPPKVPVLQYHAVQDEIVDFTQADALHRAYCAEGVRLQFNTFVSEHVAGIVVGNGTAHDWIVNRFKGAQAPSNC